jgi:hypothetical protein
MNAGQKRRDICLLTENRYLNRQPDNTYISNIFADEDLLIKALEERGISCVRASWEDDGFDWSTVRSVLFRTPWNYFDRFLDFSVWMEKAACQTSFLNSERLVRWNLDKAYLWELSVSGIPVAPGFYFSSGSSVNPEEFLLCSGWKEAVIKPAVSGTARHTWRLTPENIHESTSRFQDLLKNESMILQEFQSSVPEKGEVSLILLDGQFSHAVLKKARPGDFRVQDDFGGSLHDYVPRSEEIRLAEKALAACPELPLYARVDLVRNGNDLPLIMELELIEPELWFRRHPAAAEKMAELLDIRLKQIP